MALLGTFSAAEGLATSVTTGSRTSTSGSLVIGSGALFNSPPDSLAISSSLAGTYTEAFEVNGFASDITYAIAYNIGGTRGASHTLTCTPGTGTKAMSVAGAEFDGIDASPTVTVGTEATGTSTSPSCTVTIPSGNATVVAIVVYAGASTTISVSDGTETIEADENSDQQAHAIAHKIGQSGTVTIAWTLAASRNWSCRAIAFSEPASATPTISSVAPSEFEGGQVGVTITGTTFEASQGSGNVVISPSDNVADGSAVSQTETAWSDTSITITTARGSLNYGDQMYLFVTNDTGNSNASGYPVKFRIQPSVAWLRA